MSDDRTGLSAELHRLERLARRAERRIRAGRALDTWMTAMCVALTLGTLVLVLRKTDHLRDRTAIGYFIALFVLTLVAAVVSYLRRLPLRAGAVALDRHHGLSDRLSSAISFGALPAAEQTPFMRAAIEDAVSVTGKVKPSEAVRIPMPGATVPALLFAGALVFVGLFEIRHHEVIAATRPIDAVDVTPDDLDAMKEFLKEQENKDNSEDTKAAIEEFNQLIQDLANKRLDRTEAFRKMQALEDKLLEGKEADHKSLEEAMDKIGEEMKKADLTRPAGEALENHDLAKAEKEVRDLANKVRKDGQKLDKQQVEQMRQALEKAAQEHNERMQAMQQQRDALNADVMRARQEHEQHPENKPQEDELRKKERELQRLDQQMHQEEQTGRQLDRLDQELQQAAQDLMHDMGISADDLDQGAEDLHKMEQQEMTQQEKEELREKLQELRELMRQQGQGGQKQMVRLRRFQGHARGQGQRGQGQQGQGQQGQGQQGEGQDGQGQDGQGQDGQGQQGQGQDGQGQQGQGQQGQGGQGQGQQGQGQGGQGQNGQGQNGQGGQGQGGQGGEQWVVGPNGEKILMLTRGQGQGQGQGQQGQGGDQPGGQGQGQGGHSWGTGHDQNVQGGATNPGMHTQDTQLSGQDTGQGPTRSEVILGAAERGFASHGYKKVYTEYHDEAEESLAKDEIPGGYRFYVRRYFQLIRPREDQ